MSAIRSCRPLWLALALAAPASVIAPAIAKDAPMPHTQTATALPFPAPLQALAQAVADGDTAAIARLAADAPLQATGQDNVTLLEWAIWNRQPAALAALLDAGADPALPGMEGESVAHLAASVDDPQYLQVLIDHGAPVDLIGGSAARTPLFRAVLSRRQAQVRQLLAAGADVTRSDALGNTLLHVAAEVGDADCALQLLRAGADARATNHRGVRFESVLLAGDDARLSARGQAARQAVRQWLAEHP